MANYPTEKVEKLVDKIDKRHEQLTAILMGTDLSDQGGFVYPNVQIDADELRIAIDDFLTLLKEAKRYAK